MATETIIKTETRVTKTDYLKKLAPDFSVFDNLEYSYVRGKAINPDIFLIDRNVESKSKSVGTSETTIKTVEKTTNFYRAMFYVYPLESDKNIEISKNCEYIMERYNEGYVIIAETEDREAMQKNSSRPTLSITVPVGVCVTGVCF